MAWPILNTGTGTVLPGGIQVRELITLRHVNSEEDVNAYGWPNRTAVRHTHVRRARSSMRVMIRRSVRTINDDHSDEEDGEEIRIAVERAERPSSSQRLRRSGLRRRRRTILYGNFAASENSPKINTVICPSNGAGELGRFRLLRRLAVGRRWRWRARRCRRPCHESACLAGVRAVPNWRFGRSTACV